MRSLSLKYVSIASLILFTLISVIFISQNISQAFFSDVDSNTPYHQAIEYAQDKNIVNP